MDQMLQNGSRVSGAQPQVLALAAPANGNPVVLAYRNVLEEPEDILAKPIFGFALGSFFMGLMLNCVALYLTHHHDLMEMMRYQMEFFSRVAYVLGMTFVGSSMLLVTLKTREDHASAPLHARTWQTCLATGAFFAACLWGPGMMAEKAIPVNLYAATGFWCVLIVFPIFSSLWMVTREHVARQTAKMVEAVRPIITGSGNHM